MHTIKTRFVEFTSYFFILLFCYASISKIMDFENFQIQIAQSPLLSSFSSIVSNGVLVIELSVCVLLIFERTRLIGLYVSLFLMISFTVYIYIILNYSEFIPCSCGGILEKMDWTTHFIFNVITVLFAAISIIIYHSISEKSLFRPSINILILSFTSIVLIVALYRQSEFVIKKENNFTRRFLPHPLKEQRRLNLRSDSYYFAGSSTDSVYLGNHNIPFSVSSLDTDFDRIKSSEIIPDRYNFSFKMVQIKVQPPFYYLVDGTVPIIYKGILGNKSVKTVSFGQAFFNQIMSLDQNSYVISTYSTKGEKQSLGLVYPLHANPVELRPELLTSTSDGIFETDGQLHFDEFTKTAVYVHYYKNPLLIMDQNLHLKSQFKTIDTVSVPNIEVARMSDGKRKMNKPPLKVNKKAEFYKGILFVESDLIGKHEDRERWRDSFILDLYSISQHQYLGSIYIPNPKKSKMMQMHASAEHLYVIIDNEIIKYRFAQNILQHFISGEAENLNKE